MMGLCIYECLYARQYGWTTLCHVIWLLVRLTDIPVITFQISYVIMHFVIILNVKLSFTILSRSYFSIFNHSWFLSQGLACRPFLDMNHVNSLAPWTAVMADIKWRLQYRIWKDLCHTVHYERRNELTETVFQKILWTA